MQLLHEKCVTLISLVNAVAIFDITNALMEMVCEVESATVSRLRNVSFVVLFVQCCC